MFDRSFARVISVGNVPSEVASEETYPVPNSCLDLFGRVHVRALIAYGGRMQP